MEDLGSENGKMVIPVPFSPATRGGITIFETLGSENGKMVIPVRPRPSLPRHAGESPFWRIWALENGRMVTPTSAFGGFRL